MRRGANREGVIWGGGKIGRGFLAEIFQDAGYHISFVEYDRDLVNNLRDAGRYTIYKIQGADRQSTVSIEGFDILHTEDIDEIRQILIRDGAIAAIAVHQNALGSIATVVAQVIEDKAIDNPRSKLDIIMCVNMHSPSIYFKDLLERALPSEFHDYLNENVGLIDSVVMRICPEPTKEILLADPLAVLTNGYEKMPVDANGFRGRIPETTMLKLSQDIVAEEVRKIYTLNMSHAILAYVGDYKGYSYAYEAIKDQSIEEVVAGALEEVGAALSLEYGFSKEEMDSWSIEIIDSLKNPALDDTLVRLGSDIKRKLSAEDRLVGPAMLCMKHGIFPESIGIGIGYAFMFEDAGDEGTEDIRGYLEREGIKKGIEYFCKIEDETLISYIESIYEDL